MTCLYIKFSYIHSTLSRTVFCHALALVLGIVPFAASASAQDDVVSEVLGEVAPEGECHNRCL